jgi:hypothetical protein
MTLLRSPLMLPCIAQPNARSFRGLLVACTHVCMRLLTAMCATAHAKAWLPPRMPSHASDSLAAELDDARQLHGGKNRALSANGWAVASQPVLAPLAGADLRCLGAETYERACLMKDLYYDRHERTFVFFGRRLGQTDRVKPLSKVRAVFEESMCAFTPTRLCSALSALLCAKSIEHVTRIIAFYDLWVAWQPRMQCGACGACWPQTSTQVAAGSLAGKSV